MSIRTFAITVAVVVLALGSAVRADKPDFRVNTDGGLAEQNYPRIAVSGDRRFAVVWVDSRDGTPDIFMQRYDSDANAVGGNIRVNDNPVASFQHQPSVASDILGYYGVVWTDYRTGTYPFDPDVFYQRYDPFGALVGGNVEITTSWPDTTKEQPDISLSTWGTGIVVWADRRNDNWDIYGQLIASDGSLIGGNFRVNDDAGSAQQHAPRVSASSEGWFVVTWYDNRTGHDDIYVQRFDSMGISLGANYKVNLDGTTRRQAYPDVATDGAGHFTVVWVDWRNGIYPANPDIYAAKIDTNMNAVTPNIKINTDQSDRAQREVAISADRMGNVAIIWSDSGVSSWDIRGQMIDVDGVVREENFTANSNPDSAQLRADVALDGSYRYVTWVDRRNGNYDIYASVTKYNDPALDIQPRLLQFSMQRGGALPEAQAIVVQDLGYNRLYFEVDSYNNWLSFSPETGTTPDTIMVSIGNNSLDYGSYFGALLVTDSVNSDSTYVVSVRLDVTAPILVVAPDTLHFAAALGIDQGQSASFDVSNGADGTLTFSVVESSPWVSVSTTGGSAPTSVEVTVNAGSLAAGDHWVPVVVTAPNAMSSPDTVWVHVEVVNNVPVVGIVPDSVHIEASNLSQETADLTVINLGAGVLSWVAEVDAPWLNLGVTSGGDGDQITLTVHPSLLTEGINSAVVTVTDSGAFNIEKSAVVTCDYNVVALDTLLLSGATLDVGQSWTLPVEMRLHHAATRISLPIRYDPSVLIVDSVYPSLTLPFYMNRSVQHDPFAGEIRFDFDCLAPDTFLAPGVYGLGNVYFEASATDGYCTIDTFCSVSCAEVEFASGDVQMPVVLPGLIQVGAPTFDVDSLDIGSVVAQSGEAVGLLVELTALNEIKALGLPLEYDPLQITCDSIVFDPSWPLYMSRQYQIDSVDGVIQVSTESLAENMHLSPGYHTPATLWFTVGDFYGLAGIVPRMQGDVAPYVVTSPGVQLPPYVSPGHIQVGETGVDTVRIDAAVTITQSPVALPVHLTLVSDATRVILPIRYDPALLTADSVVLGDQLPEDLQSSVAIDSTLGQLSLLTIVSDPGCPIVAGDYLWADVYFTTGGQVGEAVVDTFANDSTTAVVEGTLGEYRYPEVSGGSVIISEPTSVEEGPTEVPREFGLHQNYPNPFNPATTIGFSLPRRCTVQLLVYNILGQVSATLVDRVLPVGDHEVIWDGRLDNGQSAPTGIYFYRLVTGEQSIVRKMLLLK